MIANPPKKSDLGVRVLSAIVMVAVAGTALWLGGWAWTLFVAAVGLGVLWEWVKLAFAFEKGPAGQAMWLLSGLVYVGLAALALIQSRSEGVVALLGLILLVMAVDIGAYAFGRTIGGPKIAPSISPSKTWAGLGGGIVGAFLIIGIGSIRFGGVEPTYFNLSLLAGGAALLAVFAQTGDFFESWMKRRAGVKDSGSFIPGHGGIFDRVDGHLAVFALVGLLILYLWLKPSQPMPFVVY